MSYRARIRMMASSTVVFATGATPSPLPLIRPLLVSLATAGLAQSAIWSTSLNRLASTWVLVSVRVVESLAWSTYSMTLFSMTQISWRVILSLGAKIPSPLPEVTPAATAFSTMGSLVSVKDWVEGVISLPVASSIRLTASSANCRRVIWS